MPVARLTVKYQRAGISDRELTVGFDFFVPTTENYQTIGNNICEALRRITTSITNIMGFEWHNVIVRMNKRYSNKAKALVNYFYASTGAKILEYSYAVPLVGMLLVSGDNTPLGVGTMFAQIDTGGGKEGKFMLRGGLTEGLLSGTNTSNWPVPGSLSAALALLVQSGGLLYPYLSGGGNPTSMVNCHVSKIGILTYNAVKTIVARRTSKYRSVQPGLS